MIDVEEADVREEAAALDALEAQAVRLAEDAVGAWRRERQEAARLTAAHAELEASFLATIRSLAFIVEARDAYTGQHLERVRRYGVALLEAMGIAADYPDAQYGFLLHDVGKVGVPDSILGKPGALTPAEWRVMRTHPLIGSRMVERIPTLNNAADIVRCHHESFDGTGYPAGLAREEIPLPARVFPVVDAFDAMTTDRPYRKALSLDHAAGELQRVAGTQFDPDCVEAFLPLVEGLLAP